MARDFQDVLASLLVPGLLSAAQPMVKPEAPKSVSVQPLLSAQPVSRPEISSEDYIMNYIIDKEGFMPEAKRPTKGDKLTIGFGHTETVKPGQKINRETGIELLKQDLQKRLPEIRRAIPNFNNLPVEVQAPLIGEWFRGSLVQSKKTRELMNKGNYAAAAKEFLKNDEYINAARRGRSGIRGRMEEAANAIRSMGQ